LILFDVTYGGSLSTFKEHHTEGTAGVICIVDSSDEEKNELAEAALSRVYARHENLLKESALLVLANKQDRIDALSVMEVMRRMELETRFEGRRRHIQ
jgi:signal recognition particle receptor subunit beta